MITDPDAGGRGRRRRTHRPHANERRFAGISRTSLIRADLASTLPSVWDASACRRPFWPGCPAMPSARCSAPSWLTRGCSPPTLWTPTISRRWPRSICSGGHPTYSFHAENAADRGLLPEHLRSLPAGAALHVGSIALMLEPVASTLEWLLLREAGRRVVSLDPNIRPGLIADRVTYLDRFRGLDAAGRHREGRARRTWLGCIPTSPTMR